MVEEQALSIRVTSVGGWGSVVPREGGGSRSSEDFRDGDWSIVLKDTGSVVCLSRTSTPSAK